MTVEEDILVRAPQVELYRTVSDMRAMTRHSPECWAVLGPKGPAVTGRSFLGLNRKGLFVWFTRCRVTQASPSERFAFDVSVFGLPVARWTYRFAPEGEGTRVTETWEDLRTGRGGRVTGLLGLVFTGTPAHTRADVNRQGMRRTLQRLKRAAEG
ncbi:SRPBCC family protein [Streptomyces sp. JJ38]|uniref:SRPBCC family protein n=1 Tax=Streptomyces sp. JJ38 TaxID=2738128 RepID=UPI00214A9192|nr:SRPBCC family protein [Streptomyces sp. JJ38]